MSDQALADAALRVAQNWPSLLREAVERIADLQRQLAEAEARAERAEQAAAEAEAREKQYRQALELVRPNPLVDWERVAAEAPESITGSNVSPAREKWAIVQALALPHDGSALAAAVERARSEEREACAKIALSHQARGVDKDVCTIPTLIASAASDATCQQIADAIRKRGTE